MNVKNDRVVSIHYTLTDDDGVELDSSKDQDPLVYLQGANNIIPGLESALEGRAIGDRVQVQVQPAEGYGEVNPDLIQTVPRAAFEGVDDIAPGMQFQAQDSAGNVQRVQVVEVSDEGVTVNGNHPLAGRVLNVDVTVEAVREATPEEIDHGHVH